MLHGMRRHGSPVLTAILTFRGSAPRPARKSFVQAHAVAALPLSGGPGAKPPGVD